MPLHGIFTDRLARDEHLASTLRTDDMARYPVVPRTVMINQWPHDLPWIIIDSTYPKQIFRRLDLLSAHRELVVDRLPGGDVAAAERELCDAVVTYLLATYPQFFQRDADLLFCPLTGLVIDVGPDGADPMVALALLASEDMLLLLPRSEDGDAASHYVLKSGALLFPNDWSLRSHFNQPEPERSDLSAWEAWRAAQQKSRKAARLGKSPAEIHEGHVSHYMQHFAARVDLFFSKMEPGMRTWRRNWGMRMSDELFLHSDRLPRDLPALTADNWERFGYLRSEHETFCKLPQSGAVVFTIKTFLWKLSALVECPLALQALLAANANLAPTMVDYRSESFPSFREFLARHSTEHSCDRPAATSGDPKPLN